MNKLRQNDLSVLTKIFFPVASQADAAVVIVHEGNPAPDEAMQELATGIIDLTGRLRLAGFHSQAYHMVKNRDGSTRWLCPVEARTPVFLKLYNGSGWRGQVFRSIFQTGYAMGLKRLVSAGVIRVFYRKKLHFETLLAETGMSEYAIFTGTVGENRKAVIALTAPDKQGWFYKLPLTESAAQLVRQEELSLRVMNGCALKNTVLPEVRDFGPGVLLTDVKPAAPLGHTRLQPVHLQALAELNRVTNHGKRLADMASWLEIQRDLETIGVTAVHNDLLVAPVTRLLLSLGALRANFQSQTYLPTSIAHGDFTPWNMYLTAERLHLYDWELAGRQPALFDAFHYIFQTGILVERLPFETIWQQVLALRGKAEVREILETGNATFVQLYGYYLLKNVSYYLARYMQQHPLHEQANWLVATWADAIEHCLELFVDAENDRTAVPSGRFL